MPVSFCQHLVVRALVDSVCAYNTVTCHTLQFVAINLVSAVYWLSLMHTWTHQQCHPFLLMSAQYDVCAVDDSQKPEVA